MDRFMNYVMKQYGGVPKSAKRNKGYKPGGPNNKID